MSEIAHRLATGKPLPAEALEYARTHGQAATPEIEKPPRPQRRPNRSFYASPEWRRARYDAIKANGGTCQACGLGPKDGVKINVDHIKPLKTHWPLRLEQSNLQVLCGNCNAGKGNRDSTDWR